MMKLLTTLWLAVMLLAAPTATVWAADGDKLEGIDITVNINQAEPEELAELLKGVGIEKAQKIVDYRKQHGKFTSADDLTQVKGIGAATVEKNRDRITL
ncbi:ComEA family DNA-binding protein [Vibrio wakamikoensis]|uniref:ComEA family DNA-binding protein n=2 Tax=Vibrionaceae TaxID=641 RepID=A0AAU8BPN7_9VIBR